MTSSFNLSKALACLGFKDKPTTKKEVQQAWLKAVKASHPDKFMAKGPEAQRKATERIKDINWAKEFLEEYLEEASASERPFVDQGWWQRTMKREAEDFTLFELRWTMFGILPLMRTYRLDRFEDSFRKIWTNERSYALARLLRARMLASGYSTFRDYRLSKLNEARLIAEQDSRKRGFEANLQDERFAQESFAKLLEPSAYQAFLLEWDQRLGEKQHRRKLNELARAAELDTWREVYAEWKKLPEEQKRLYPEVKEQARKSFDAWCELYTKGSEIALPTYTAEELLLTDVKDKWEDYSFVIDSSLPSRERREQEAKQQAEEARAAANAFDFSGISSWLSRWVPVILGGLMFCGGFVFAVSGLWTHSSDPYLEELRRRQQVALIAAGSFLALMVLAWAIWRYSKRPR